MPLTIKQVKTAVASGKPGKIADGRCLYLWVRGTGRGAWLYQYRDGGKMRSRVLGTAGEVTPDEARAARDAFVVALRNGNAPAPTRKSAKAAATAARPTPDWPLSRAVNYYLDIHGPEWTPRTARRLAVLAKAHLVGGLADKSVSAITVYDVADVLQPIWTKASHAKGGRLRALLESAFTACAIKPNPALWHELKPHMRSLDIRTKHYPAMPAADVPALMGELAADSSAASRCLRFLILTACRTGEAIGADWSRTVEIEQDGVTVTVPEIDLDKRLWTIPGERTKTRKPHVVPLSDAALACLWPQAAVGLGEKATGPVAARGHGLAFKVGTTASGRMNICSLNRHLHKLRSGYTVHGFRAAFRTWGTENAYRHDVLEAALAHVRGDATQRAYDRADLLDARRKLMADWAIFATAHPNHSCLLRTGRNAQNPNKTAIF